MLIILKYLNISLFFTKIDMFYSSKNNILFKNIIFVIIVDNDWLLLKHDQLIKVK